MSFFKKLFGKSETKNPTDPTPIQNNNVPSESRQNPEPPEDEGLTILPRVKVDYSHEIYARDSGRSFTGNPLPAGIELPEDQKPIAKKLYADLILCFAVDEGNSYKILQNELFAKNPNLTEDILHQLSLNGLIEEIGQQIKINGDPKDLLMVTAGGNFEAAIILLDHFWEQMHQLLGGNAVLSIPARDLLFICKQGNHEALGKLRSITKGYFDKPETEGLLSKAIYLKEIGNPSLKILETTF